MPKDAKDLKHILEGHAFLKDLPSRYLDLLVGCASNHRFEDGSYLFHIGQPADKFYLIRSGRVGLELEMTHRQPVVVQTLDAGEFLGWSWLLPPYQWHFSARANGQVLALAFDAKCIREKMAKDHELGYEMFRRFAEVISQRLVHTLPQILGMYR
jgi:CRP/FNR family transcriptional regulator, cyclic AMP receptor protein